jgi:hypothetical protein
MDTITALSFAAGRVELRVADATLAAGLGAHRLRLDTTTQAHWLDPDQPDDTGVMFVQGFVWLDQPMTAIGPVDPQVVTLRGHPVNEGLWVTLSDEQLRAVEVARAGGDVALRIDLQGALVGATSTVHPVATGQFAHRVPAAQWLAMLDHAGAHVALSIRVPSPFTDASAVADSGADPRGVSQGAVRLRQARDHLADGRPRDCVMACRLVLENVARLRTLPGVGPVPKKRGQAERWAALHNALYSLASATGHDDETTENFTWSRADAEAVLVTTAGLLARVRV